MSATTELDLQRVRDLLGNYRIGDLVRYWPASGGIENSNYFVATLLQSEQREYVLTIIERPPHSGDAIVPLLDTCVAAGLPVPAVVRTRDGAAFADADGKPVMVCPRLPGRHVCNPTLRQLEALGRFLARFHVATTAAELQLPEYPRDIDWLQRNAKACQGFLPYHTQTLLTDTRLRLASALAREDLTLLPRGAIHGDLFRDNVLFDDRGLTGVLDFHHAADGFLLYDLAVAINDWCTRADGSLDLERTLALLRAYHRTRPICRIELWYLPIFQLYAALAFWTSRLVVAVKQRRGATLRGNNPLELQRIVEHCNAHFLYLDERQLL
ncbi:MAG: phosphotransferase [Pseudomonadales bacterium]